MSTVTTGLTGTVAVMGCWVLTRDSHAHVTIRTMFYGLGGCGIRMYPKGMQARPVKTVKVRFRFFSTRWNLCGADRRFPPMATLDGPELSSRHDSRPRFLCVLRDRTWQTHID